MNLTERYNKKNPLSYVDRFLLGEVILNLRNRFVCRVVSTLLMAQKLKWYNEALIQTDDNIIVEAQNDYGATLCIRYYPRTKVVGMASYAYYKAHYPEPIIEMGQVD